MAPVELGAEREDEEEPAGGRQRLLGASRCTPRLEPLQVGRREDVQRDRRRPALQRRLEHAGEGGEVPPAPRLRRDLVDVAAVEGVRPVLEAVDGDEVDGQGLRGLGGPEDIVPLPEPDPVCAGHGGCGGEGARRRLPSSLSRMQTPRARARRPPAVPSLPLSLCHRGE